MYNAREAAGGKAKQKQVRNNTYVPALHARLMKPKSRKCIETCSASCGFNGQTWGRAALETTISSWVWPYLSGQTLTGHSKKRLANVIPHVHKRVLFAACGEIERHSCKPLCWKGFDFLRPPTSYSRFIKPSESRVELTGATLDTILTSA